MESEDFEFVKADEQHDEENVYIKNEPFDEMLVPDVKLFDNGTSGETGKSKCGEIFTVNSGYFILICAFCNDEFESMRTFGIHMRNKHEGGTSLATSALTGSVTPTIKSQPQTALEEDKLEQLFDGFFDTGKDVQTESRVNSRYLKAEVINQEIDVQNLDTADAGRDHEDGDDDSFKLPSGASSSESSDDEENNKRQKEDRPATLKCNTCNRKYKNKKTLYRHQNIIGCKQMSKPVDPELFCVPCNRQLKTKKTFQRHQKVHDNRIKREIDDNSGGEESSPTKSKPDSTVQDPSLLCELCNRYFKSRSNLRTHAERHDTIPAALQGDPEFLKCKYCDEPCSDYPTRKQHEITHTGDHPYICRICQKTFATIYKKNMHVALHTGERPHQCPQCPNSYLTKRDVLRHITYRHLNVRRFKCDFCDKSCYRKTELAIHMRRHTGEKPYVCEDCGNSFAALSQLKSHQLRHTQTKNFKCDQCGRFFYSSTSLKDHQASHSDAKPFGCDVCGRRFPRAKALKKHKKLHSDVKAYICNICGKAYAQDSGLYAHKKSHGLFSNPQGTQFSVPLT